METTVQKREPEMTMGSPVWYHHHGMKMRVDHFDRQKRILIINSPAAKVAIQQASSVCPDATGWFVDWEVVQCRPFTTGSRGRVQLTDEELKSAFGLTETLGHLGGQAFIEQYGADVAAQGRFIRYQNYLNIPCPGTGHDGDPNVSIELCPDIKAAVAELLG